MTLVGGFTALPVARKKICGEDLAGFAPALQNTGGGLAGLARNAVPRRRFKMESRVAR